MKQRCSEGKGCLMVLSPREQDVLTLIACGLTDKEIAVKLQISIKTTQTHATKVLFKLRAKTRANAVAIYIKKNPKWKIGERYLLSL